MNIEAKISSTGCADMFNHLGGDFEKCKARNTTGYRAFKISVCSGGPGRKGVGAPFTQAAWPAR